MGVRISAPIVAVAALLALAAAPPALAAPGDVLVRFRSAAEADDRGAARRAAKVRRKAGLPVPGLELADTEAGVSAAAAAARLERDPDVLYAEPDVPRRTFAIPNDRLFGLEWGMHNAGQTVQGTAGTEDADIDAPEAWDLVVGDPSVLVAVVDTGVDVAHPDLAPNVWVNPREVAGNGLDDDRNGFVDDVRGWDFVEGDGTPQDADGHGTHVAGTAGARGDDGIGVAGAAWRSSILPLRVLGPNGEGAVSDAIRAYAYAAAAGARVVNLSLGGPSGSRAERDALAAQSGVLFVAAAGNDGADNDVTGSFPCNYELVNVVCVGATDQRDTLAPFSNRGLETVDLAAPGVSIASDYPDARVAYMDGTSMATPHVSGVAALLVSARPGATPAQLRAALLDGVDLKPSLAATTVTGGRLNALGALQALGAAPVSRDDTGGSSPPPPPPPPPPAQPQPQPSPEPQPSPQPQPEPSPQPQPEPQPQPAPAPAPTTPLLPLDRSAPFARVSTLSPSRDLAAFVRRRALRVSLRCNEPCAVRVDLRRGDRTIARGTGRVARATGAVTVRLRLSAREARRLRRLRMARLILRVRSVDAVGNARTTAQRVTLRRRS